MNETLVVRRKRAAERRIVLQRLVSERAFTTQEQIMEALVELGHGTSPGTLSRDLALLGIVRNPNQTGEKFYRREPGAELGYEGNELSGMLRSFVVDIRAMKEWGGVVIDTEKGHARGVSLVIRSAGLPSVVTTICDEDVILVITDTQAGAFELVNTLEAYL